MEAFGKDGVIYTSSCQGRGMGVRLGLLRLPGKAMYIGLDMTTLLGPRLWLRNHKQAAMINDQGSRDGKRLAECCCITLSPSCARGCAWGALWPSHPCHLLQSVVLVWSCLTSLLMICKVEKRASEGRSQMTLIWRCWKHQQGQRNHTNGQKKVRNMGEINKSWRSPDTHIWRKLIRDTDINGWEGNEKLNAKRKEKPQWTLRNPA